MFATFVHHFEFLQLHIGAREMFVLIYVVGLTEKEILLFAHWSFMGVTSTAVGALIKGKTNFNFKEFGYTMIGFVELGMLCQVYGYSPLNYL